jgi:hypothetical protein
MQYRPVRINTHYNAQKLRRGCPLKLVADLIGALKERDYSPIHDELTVFAFPRSALASYCFATNDESFTALDPVCPLSDLGDQGLNSLEPLIIKTQPPARKKARICIPQLKQEQAVKYALGIGVMYPVEQLSTMKQMQNIYRSNYNSSSKAVDG